jgi:hypothetical protein
VTEVAAPHRQQALDQRLGSAGMAAVRIYRHHPCDQQREQADEDRSGDLVVEPREDQEGGQREDERGQPGKAGNQQVPSAQPYSE